MNRDTYNKINVLSKELNDLLNEIHESSKRFEKLTLKLVVYNSSLYLWQKIRTVRGGLAAAGISAGGIAAYTADAFEYILALPASSIVVLAVIIILLAGALLRSLVLEEMSTIGSDMFHLGVYEKRKKKEYSSLVTLAREKDFIMTLKERLEQELQEDPEKLWVELKQKQEVIEEKNMQIEEKNTAIEQKNDALNTLLEELDRSEDSAVFFKEKSDFLIAILYQLKSKLNLLVNDQFNLDNIDFGSNYTLYQAAEDGLHYIGGYGVNKAEFDVFIPLEREDDKYIRSMEKTQSDPLIIGDFISWKRTLQDGSEWILSLHLDNSNRDKLNAAEETGKLNLTITQEVLWICCELLNKFAGDIRPDNGKGEV
ncbi:hypothetical protein [Evansella clarkii]|uniref:hypothetical protein n=1 Tax=Evansella clarkii TaxID=79879 RepID=UPI0009972153|nr:hypothetical protein [Evansella clarkii]